MAVVQVSTSNQEANVTNTTVPGISLQAVSAVCRPSGNEALPLAVIIGIISGGILLVAAVVAFFREPLRSKARRVMKRRERDVLDRELTDVNVMLKKETSIYETMVETSQNLKSGFQNWWNSKAQPNKPSI